MLLVTYLVRGIPDADKAKHNKYSYVSERNVNEIDSGASKLFQNQTNKL
jgi:hypothetical protein